MRRLSWLLPLLATAALAQPVPMTPLRLAVIHKATAPSLADGGCVFGTSPDVLADDTGVIYTCIDDASDNYAAVPGATGGDITTDAAWAAKGDLIVGTGNDAASILTKGTDGYFLKANSGTGTGLEWVVLAGGGDALVGNSLAQFAATTSAELAGVLSDETGTGLACFNTAPNFVNPVTFEDPTSHFNGQFDFSGLTADRVFGWSNAGGTVALTSDIPPASDEAGFISAGTTACDSGNIGAMFLNASSVTDPPYICKDLGDGSMPVYIPLANSSGIAESANTVVINDWSSQSGYLLFDFYTPTGVNRMIGSSTALTYDYLTNTIAASVSGNAGTATALAPAPNFVAPVTLEDPTSHFKASLDSTLLTADRAVSFPDRSGTFWVDGLDYGSGLSAVDDPVLSWTPLATSNATGFKVWTVPTSGSPGYFQFVMDDTTGTVTATVDAGSLHGQTGKWKFASADTAEPIVEVAGYLKATRFNLVTITQPATSATLTIANNATLTVNTSTTLPQTTVSGNAGTATALAANGSNCTAGSYAGGTSASGVAEDCTVAFTAAGVPAAETDAAHDTCGEIGGCVVGAITAADVPAAETDAAHDTCAEISGCVVGALSAEVDGSTTNELQNIFQTVATTSGTSPVADTTTDTLTITAGTGITVTGDSATDTVIIAATGLTSKCDAWPVSSIFISVSSTNPGTTLGCGTWTAFATGRVLVGIDSGDATKDAAEETGGANTVASSNQTFTGTASSVVVNHVHVQNINSGTTGGTNGYGVDTSTNTSSASGYSTANPTSGGAATYTPAGTNAAGAATSVEQPYIAVYMWKRSA